MIVFLIFILVIVGFNLIPLLTKKRFLNFERTITKLLILVTVIFLVSLILLTYGFKLKGLYSNFTIGAFFVLTSLTYFALIRNTKRKILIIVILTPMIFLSLFTLLFGRTIYEHRVTDNLKIGVSTGGIMTCGEHIILTESKLGIFDKEVYHDGTLCLKNIDRIETKNFDNDSAVFLIYHDGEWDSENPYFYEIENKNVW